MEIGEGLKKQSLLSVGDIVEFGRYPQDSDGTERPIKWQVLAIENGRALLFSKCGLDCVQYHSELADITWETCDLRRWLNEDFYASAFNNSEQSRIAEVQLRNACNPEYGTDGGHDTYDKVFCLSIDEAEKYFSSDDDRQRKPAAYAMENGALAYCDTCWYWLRSPGGVANCAAGVFDSGFIDNHGDDVNLDNYALVPALFLNL